MKDHKIKYLKIKTLLVVILLYQFSTSFSSANTKTISEYKPFQVKRSSSFIKADDYTWQLAPHFKLIIDRNELWKPPSELNSVGLNTPKKLSYFLLKHNAAISTDLAKQLAVLYVNEAKEEGINHDIAFSQMCLETGFLSYRGSVKMDQYNFCGLGAVDEFSSGAKFKNMQEGVRAHIQHLKAYSNEDQLNNSLVDDRFRFVKRGSATTVSQLTGKWAADQSYGEKITNLLERLYASKMN